MSDVQTGLLAERIPYIRTGRGPKPLVVFFGVNALFRRIDQYRPERYAKMIRDLAPQEYTCWILGYPEQPYDSLDALVTDFAKPIREEIGPAAVIGVSFGGFVAQRFAAEHPSLVTKLVLLVSAHRFSAEGQRRVAGQLQHLRRGDMAALVRENALLFRRPWLNAMVRMKLWKDRHRLAEHFNDPAMISLAYLRYFGEDLARNEGHVRRIAAPSIVIGGTADPFFDQTSFRETASAIPDCRLKLFGGETHMLPVEYASGVAMEIEVFLRLP